MYRRPKFLEILLEIRQEMALEADYDVDLFAEKIRTETAPVAEAIDRSSTNGKVQPAKTKVRSPRKTEVKIASE